MTASSLSATSVRRWILLGLSSISLVSYLERSNISVAAELMIPALGITKVQMGQIFSSFLIGYAVFQIPGGFLGDRYGPRRTLAISSLIWGVATILTALLTAFFSPGTALLLTTLWLVRFCLGIGEATTFPVGNRMVRNWTPPSERAFGTSVMMLGTCTASAISPPLVSFLMTRYGWRASFYLTALPAFVIAFFWLRFATDTPATHPGVNATELALISAAGTARATSASGRAPLLRLLQQRSVYLLIISYVSEGYLLFIFVFWLYIYLVEKRGFSMIRGGWLAALPWLTATALTPLGGKASDLLAARYGRLHGARIMVMIGYGGSGLLLLLAAYATSSSLSVVSLCLSIALLMSAESSFWASAAHLGGEHVGILSGVMNTAGVIGGILSTSLVPVLVEHFGWLTAFASGTLMGLFSVLVWVAIREPRPVFSGQ